MMKNLTPMTRSDILNLLVAELRTMAIAVPPTDYEELAFRENLGMDSLGVAEYIARLEWLFGILVSDDDWKRLRTMRLVVDYVEERLQP